MKNIYMSLFAFSLIGITAACQSRTSLSPEETPNSSETEGFSEKVSKTNSVKQIFSTQALKDDSVKGAARCFYSVESANVLTPAQANANKDMKLLNPSPVRDRHVVDSLNSMAKENVRKIVEFTSGATAACAGAATTASATVASLLGPGTQVVSPASIAFTITSLVGCGFSAKNAADALWSAWIYNDLKKKLPLTDANFSTVKKPKGSLDALSSAVQLSKFHYMTNYKCEPKITVK
jgi:hypothetical protein